jgi:hypothetical protein
MSTLLTAAGTSITIYATSTAYIGTYTLQITASGTLNSVSSTLSTTYTLTVANNCLGLTSTTYA